jgi:hypothetical protein
LPEKYDGSVNPTEFLQIYSTTILAVGGNEAVMTNYFLVALTGTARSWLMNLPKGPSPPGESCVASSWPTSRVPTLTPATRLTSMRFFQVQNTISHISNTSIVVTFRQCVRDEKILEKLATHDVEDVSELFSLADKCARAAEGHARHSQPAPEAGKASKAEVDAAAQSSSRNRNRKKKKADDNNIKPLTGAPTAAAAAAAAGGARGT